MMDDIEVNGSALRARFLSGMSHAACTVNIVTTDGAAGRAGVTVSAMSSVSADTPKPTLLVCVHHLAAAAAKIVENGVFCVNVLRDDQSYISDAFAGRFRDQLDDKFDCAEWTTQATGAPRVVDPLVAFDCRVASQERVGTHFVFIGEVEDLFIAERGSPLIYANRAYGAAWRIDSAESLDAGRLLPEKSLAIGCLHTFGPYILPALLRRLTAETSGLDVQLFEGDQRRVQESLSAGQTELALLYDIDLPDDLETGLLTYLTPYVLLAEGHALAEKTELTPQDLAKHPMVLLNARPSSDFFLGIMLRAGVEPHIAFRSASFEMVRGMVGHGLGYALLGTKPASAMTYDGRALVSRPLVSDEPPSRVVLATRRNRPLTATAQMFADLCRAHFDEGGGGSAHHALAG